MLNSLATGEATAAYAARFPGHQQHQFYRIAQGLAASSLGLGSYLGNMDEASGAGYRAAVDAALRGGINFFDTSLNYRHQASERNIGEAIEEAVGAGVVRRPEVILCTKAGYLVPGAAPKLDPADVVGAMHSMSPAFLEDQLGRSLVNLRVSSVDVFYLHNPETQLRYVSQDEFYGRIQRAFECLETQVAAGRVGFYGAATWNGYRTTGGEALSLVRMEQAAREVAGASHHFRFVQLPLNLAMLEGAALPRERVNGREVSTVEAAGALGITVVASATLLQTRLLGHLQEIASRFPGAASDAQRAIQFTRWTPGVSVALVGMSNPAHVAENLGVAGLGPADVSPWLGNR